MEGSTVSGLRSRSRSKTPFLRSSCDHEHCTETEEHTHKSGRKTPIKRSTPIKQLQQTTSKTSKTSSSDSTTTTTTTTTVIREESEELVSQPSARTRQSMKAAENLVKTSDYSSEESLDRLRGHGKEIFQNEVNSQYERVSTTSRYQTLADLTLSPIHGSNVTADRSTRFSSPAHSACSTDSSFAEQALADATCLLDRDPNREHLPYRLYKMAGEYWNKYPKTDYTYSPLSKDRVELAPGQVAVPNMSRRSLSQFRVQGPNTTTDEVDVAAWASSCRKRYTSIDSSDDESYFRGNGGYAPVDQRWWLTRLLVTIVTTITTSVTSTYRGIVGPSHRYPYTERRPQQAGMLSRSAAAVAAPFYWIYTAISSVLTTTVTTVTETFSPSAAAVGSSSKRSARVVTAAESERRWWPWLLMLFLPLLGYGCYNYSEYMMPQEIKDTYKPPVIVQDSDLTKRVAALEDWALNVDTRLKYFDQKLSKFDNLEQKIEQYSIRYLQNNLVQIINADGNSEAVAAKLKNYFDKHYITKEQMQKMSIEIHERLISSWQPEMDEDKIRSLIQEYLSVFEKRQMEVIVERFKEYVREVVVRREGGGGGGEFDAEAVRRIVAGMLDVYDADKTGMVDYALESAGGQVVSTKCTELYQIKTKQYSVLGLPVWWVYTSPRFALTPGAMPAECWAFQGFPGYLVVRTYAVVEVTGFSVEHMSRLLAVDGKIESAPKNFSVYGLHGEQDPEPHLFGNYMYDANGTAIQHFPVQFPKLTDIGGVNYPVAYDIIELRVESNHGNPTYTCVYRFRVHGNPLSDIRAATEDSIRESET